MDIECEGLVHPDHGFLATSRLDAIKMTVASMRPHQWYKNLILFIGIIFSGNLFNTDLWGVLILAFVTFCLVSGSQYILNDIFDIEKDRLHQKKRYRPIAAGSLSKKTALFVALSLIVVSLTAAFYISVPFGVISAFYFTNSIAYTLYLKYYAIVDAIVIAVGFVIRAVAGCIAIDVVISPWLILCVFLLALVLAFGKRRYELQYADETRDCLSQYTASLSESLINLSVSMLLMSYALYSISVNFAMMLTFPFAFYGIFRYVQLVHLNNFGGETELLLKDNPSIMNLSLWVGLVILIRYGIFV